ncbi:MAG: hypothetical protein M1820_001775 [Bogoriella megaspora]|nr:MAG: hypothetical protein M1820_001775 [Bogoriella megaspora]
MTGGTDIASLIGTWIAAAVAVIALVGIWGPLRAIYQQRSDYALSLKAIDDPEKEVIVWGFNSSFTPSPFRKVKIPDLIQPPSLRGGQVLRDESVLDQFSSRTGWLMFARMPKAYKLQYQATGNLRMTPRGGSAIPVHNLWILVIGLLGRYGHRRDEGRTIGHLSGRLDHRGLLEDKGEEAQYDPTILYGVTGRLQFSPKIDAGTLYFKPHDHMSRGQLYPDGVPFETLFWLSLACMPLQDGRIFDISKEGVSEFVTRAPGKEGPVKAYRFQEIERPEAGSTCIQWANALCNGKTSIWYYSECKQTPEEINHRDSTCGSQIKESDREISPDWHLHIYRELNAFDHEIAFFWKPDLHILALAIITIRPCPRGLMFPRYTYGSFFNTLFPNLWRDINYLGRALQTLFNVMVPEETSYVDDDTALFTRTRLRALYDFDPCIKELQQNRRPIPKNYLKAVQVLFLTTKFLDDEVLTLDPASRAFRIIKPLQYEIGFDFEKLFSVEEKHQKQVTLRFGDVLLACLQAWIRKMAFDTSIDSSPLIYFVESIPTISHLSDAQLPPQQNSRRIWKPNPIHPWYEPLDSHDLGEPRRAESFEDEVFETTSEPESAGSRVKMLRDRFESLRSLHPWTDKTLQLHLNLLEPKLVEDLWDVKEIDLTPDLCKRYGFPLGLRRDFMETNRKLEKRRRGRWPSISSFRYGSGNIFAGNSLAEIRRRESSPSMFEDV